MKRAVTDARCETEEIRADIAGRAERSRRAGENAGAGIPQQSFTARDCRGSVSGTRGGQRRGAPPHVGHRLVVRRRQRNPDLRGVGCVLLPAQRPCSSGWATFVIVAFDGGAEAGKRVPGSVRLMYGSAALGAADVGDYWVVYQWGQMLAGCIRGRRRSGRLGCR